MKATFVDRQPLTNTIASFSFKPERPLRFTAGQYIDLTLMGHVEGGEPAERWFTISSSPRDELVTITTRIGAAAHTAFKRALDKLEPGASVDISDPMGAFVLPKLIQTPLVFVAGGIGITPFHSMLSWLVESGEQRPISMIYSVSKEEDIIFQDTFDRAGQHVTCVVSDPSPAWGGERGRLSAEMVLGLQSQGDDALFYISGPEPFAQQLQKDLQTAGISNQRLITDEFQGYSTI